VDIFNLKIFVVNEFCVNKLVNNLIENILNYNPRYIKIICD